MNHYREDYNLKSNIQYTMEIKISDKYSKNFSVTAEMIEGFAMVTGDKNPVHLDEKYAENTIFKSRIAHGFLVGSFISAVLGNDFPGNGTIYVSQNLKFMKPVFIGDMIQVHVEVTEITDKDWLVLKTECFNQNGKAVLVGEATVIPPVGANIIH
jgi:3-hydroxybutyryl-CoA dehydratase